MSGLKSTIQALCVLAVLCVGCSEGSLGPGDEHPLSITVSTSTPYTITAESELIGGPQAQGRVGDILISNDVIRVIIQKRGKYPGISSFGGNIIDADRVRSTAVGGDEFGYMWPLVNGEWTLNGVEFMAFDDGFDLDAFLGGQQKPIRERLANNKTPVIVTRGIIDVYDYLDLDFLEPIAASVTGQEISFDPRFDDMFAPFEAFDLRGMRIEAYTAYRIPPGERYVEITTTFFNDSDEPIPLPMGDYLNGSGNLQLLIPGLGFSPELSTQILGDTPAVLYLGQEGVDVSYGYFYRLEDFVKEDDDGVSERLTSASLTYSGVTGVLFGEEFTKVFPLGSGQSARINFEVPAKASRSFTRYLVIGDGSAGSLLDAGLKAMDIPRQTISGWVIDRDGVSVAQADVAVLNKSGNTIVTYRTDGKGRFSGYLSDGSTQFAQALGGGHYTLRVEKRGHSDTGSQQAGSCTPSSIAVTSGSIGNILCTLGRRGVVEFDGPMHDAATQRAVPVRVSILGVDPSPDRAFPGVFTDTNVNGGPYGIVAFHYINAKGGVDLTERRWIALEPGEYLFAFSRGPEYELRVDHVHVGTSGITKVHTGTLQRVMTTPGYISGDFHVHARGSPDSGVPGEQRALAASGEGLDVLHSSDHDMLYDYDSVVDDLVDRGWIPANTLATIVGVEITPNNMGHIHAFPLTRDELEPNGWTFDWSGHPDDTVDPSPDYQLSVQEIYDEVTKRYGDDIVFQMNHISDSVLSLLNTPGTVTSPAYRDDDGIEPLSVFTDPMLLRYPAGEYDAPPYAWGTTPFTSPDFTAAELTIGDELNGKHLWETGLPQWFNLMNFGLIMTATADSDSHKVHRPVGMPRNFIKLDGGVDSFDPKAYAKAINDHQVVVSAGPFITITAKTDEGLIAEIGETVRGQSATITVKVRAPSWAWFDTIELYANTEPTPVDDDGVSMMKGIAAQAETFFAPYHRPKFTYDPIASFRLRDATLESWEEKDGLITAEVKLKIDFDTDTWVVAVAHGTPGTPSYRSIFPLATFDVAEGGQQPQYETLSMEAFYADPLLPMPAWAFTNPIFFDVDGDTNGDGKAFESLYIKRGWSPLGN